MCPAGAVTPGLGNRSRPTSKVEPLGSGSGGRPAGTAPWATSRAMSFGAQVGADRLDPGAVDEQVDHVGVGPHPHRFPLELLPRHSFG